MKKNELKQRLQMEVDAQALKSYDDFMRLQEGISYEKGIGDNWYHVTVDVLDKTESYVHVLVCIDDGGWRAFYPLSDSFLIYKDGRVDK
jgi:hypothetical protein